MLSSCSVFSHADAQPMGMKHADAQPIRVHPTDVQDILRGYFMLLAISQVLLIRKKDFLIIVT